MTFLMFLIYFSVPTLVIFAIQYLFCRCKYMVVKLIPTIAAFCFLFWFLAPQSQLPEEPRGCSTGAGIAAFFVSGICISLFIGISVGWLVSLKKSDSKEENKEESEE
ncbi:hypothetical protein N510_002155 [Firmicutes bacterium ASF500]|nr:hypothetical protein N510_002155 [Firmicutes bacterium ASF500]